MQSNMRYDIIEQQELQRIQDNFCKLTGICALCLNDEYQMITEISGATECKQKLHTYMQEGKHNLVLSWVKDGSLEDQAVENIGENGDRLAAIAMRSGGKAVLYWVVLLCGPQDTADSMQFFYILDVIRDLTNALWKDRISGAAVEAEILKSRFAEQEMSRNLQTIEATAEIVQLLDSDEHVEKIIRKWLKIVSEHLKTDTAEVDGINIEENCMDVLCEWCAPGLVSYYDRTSNQEIPEILRSEKTLALSSDTAEGRMKSFMASAGLGAVIVLPILTKDHKPTLSVSLNHRKRHNWSMAEVKFASDAAKLLQSILTKREQQDSLATSHEAMKAILDNVGCCIYVKDVKSGNVLFVNKKFQKNFAQELQDGTFEELLEQGWEAEKNKGFAEIFHEPREMWYDLVGKEIAWVDGREAMLYSLYNITDKKIYQRKIEQQAYTDFLTGLYNRMCCERDLARQIDIARKAGTFGALLYLDLDDFKHINDGLGHQYGDILLKSISGALKKIEGIENTCYRMGGDEFVIVVPTENYCRFEHIVEEIKRVFSKAWFLNGAEYYCTMSMGIVTFPDMGNSVADLIVKADIAMYEAKKSGKNRVSVYHEGTDAGSGRRLDLEKNMRDASATGYQEFEVYYQPVMDVQGDGDKCAGAEALIRWNSEKFGFLPPSEFIPLAEYLGLINPIGNFILREACTRCKMWNDNGHPDYKVNVNLSVVQLLQNDVVETVEQIIRETGITPENLTLEVTESLAINDMERMNDIIRRIKALGVKIALDDFGTGYSSLNHIREIPLDVIKVDQSFVKDLAMDAYSQSFVKMIAELAGTLGANVCVEGVETQAQYEIVRKLNVKYIQGYYFGRPMPGAEFDAKFV